MKLSPEPSEQSPKQSNRVKRIANWAPQFGNIALGISLGTVLFAIDKTAAVSKRGYSLGKSVVNGIADTIEAVVIDDTADSDNHLETNDTK